MPHRPMSPIKQMIQKQRLMERVDVVEGKEAELLEKVRKLGIKIKKIKENIAVK